MKRRIWLIASIIFGLILIRHLYLYHTGDIKELMLWLKENLGWKAALIAGIVYVLLLSVPFFPGIELAWLVILLFGKDAVIMIYLLTLLGLGLSFGIGRWFEKSWLTAGLDLKKLKENLINRTESIKKKFKENLPATLVSHQPTSFQVNPRYVLLAILINLPGNTIIGGGGGIALLCGMNRSFSWKGFMSTIAIASSPVPLLLYFGLIQIETFIN